MEQDWTIDRFRQELAAINNRGRWGDGDELGTINLVGRDNVRLAASLVREGVVVPCAQMMSRDAYSSDSGPFVHVFLWGGQFPGGPTPDAWMDEFIGLRPHGLETTHVDALCHLSFDGLMYNGVSDRSAWMRRGPSQHGIERLNGRLVSRGILFDLPRITGVDWLEPGTAIRVADLENAEEQLGVRVSEGDFLLIRNGRYARRRSSGPWVEFQASAGLHPECGRWLAERGVALLASDGANDLLPSPVAGVAMPIHVLCLVGMGMPLLDSGDFESLAETCATLGRWEFLFAVPTLALEHGTASPVTPHAIL